MSRRSVVKAGKIRRGRLNALWHRKLQIVLVPLRDGTGRWGWLA